MEIIREGPSASRPPILDGKNYSYWKPRMIFFIKTLDGRVWRALVAGYEPPMVTLDEVSVPKPEVNWTDAEEQASVRNARAINAIFNGVDLNVFKLINSCTTAKDTWKILEVAYEGTSKVKISKLQLITSKFEALKMIEDELASEYNERVLEIANDSLLLSEKISESKIVRKVLHFLSRKFDMKVTAIEEVQDITTLKLDELFGSLLTFEMAMSNREINQNESIALFTKQFSKMARKLKSMNTAGITVKTRRHDGENSTTKVNDFSYRRNSDHGQNGSSKYGLRFNASMRSVKLTPEDDETSVIPNVTSTLLKEIPKDDSRPDNLKLFTFCSEYRMDVKSAFLNDYLNEEVFVAQPKGFVDSEFPQHVYKLNKALYGLKQAPRAWTPVATHVKVTKDINGTVVDHKLYRSMVGSLLYLKASRPVIAYAVGICAQFQSGKALLEVVSLYEAILSHGSGSYMTQPYEDAPEVTISSPPVRQVKEEASSKLHESVLPESMLVVCESSVSAASVAHAPRVPTTTVSDMDSDDQDDVPLARFLKKTLILDVSNKLPIDPPSSIHSHKTCSPLTSPPLFTSVDAHKSVLDAVPGDISAAPMRHLNDRQVGDISGDISVAPQHPDIDTAEVPLNDDNNLAVPPASADIPAASKPAEKKAQQKRRNITTKTDRKKIPPNVPSVPIDGISFHHEECPALEVCGAAKDSR
ncbi:gag-pol polyprotein [Cucumis melo var. makuwa]|uniref:Gag-pol polyprotein n=1 Tax=Cucumis melo var. makuwa TaxID=1194695 RepID=A0A5A7T4B1_CUCMM|nr:gag-pol polyprotein [Cucumis melo var. makuwa]